MGNVQEKLDYRCFNTVTLDCIDVDVTQQSIVYSRVFQFRSNGMALEPNTAASVYDSQLVTMANIHSLLVQGNPVISGW